jgi:uncharacterized protein (DUF302 family)
MINYGFTKELAAPFEQVKESAIAELKKEGFGILTEIDVRAKFKEKLGIEFKNYVILGACHPPSAHKAILAEENIGLLLPCNVIVYEMGNGTVISVIRPTVAMQVVGNPELEPLGKLIEAKLKAAFDAVSCP